MGFLGMSGKTWKKVGKYALKAAPIVAAPFTGGASLLALGAGAGALSGALDGGGWKGALMGGALGAIPGGGGAGTAAGSVAKTGLKTGLTQAAKSGGKQIAGGLASKYLPGPAGQIAGAAIGGYGGGANIGANLRNAGKAALSQGGATAASKIPGVGGVAGGAAGAGLQTAFSGAPGASFGANMRNAGKAALSGAQAGGTNMAGNYLTQQFQPTAGFGASARPGGPAGYDFRTNATGTSAAPGGTGTGTGAGAADDQGFDWRKWGPPIAEGAALGVGALVGRQAQKNALKRSPEETAALTGAQGVGKDAASAAAAATGQSKPWMQQSGNYFSTLLSGNRAAMSQATAAPMAQISQQYRGAERGLERSGVRGAARDVAAGELGRDRVSKMAGLTTGVQPYAAEQLGKLGLDAGNQAAGLYGVAGNVYGNLLETGQRNRIYSRQEGGKAGEAIGKLAATVGNTIAGQAPKKPAAPGSTPVPPVSRLPGAGGIPPITAKPGVTAPAYPGGKVAPPLLGGGGYAGDYDPTKWDSSRVRF